VRPTDARSLRVALDRAAVGRCEAAFDDRGNDKVKRDPLPKALSTVTSPCIARARSRLIANPRPTPPLWSVSPALS